MMKGLLTIGILLVFSTVIVTCYGWYKKEELKDKMECKNASSKESDKKFDSNKKESISKTN